MYNGIKDDTKNGIIFNVAKYDKLLTKIKSGPKHTTITELIKLMEQVGFTYRKGSKNHYIFYGKTNTICVAPPHPGKFVKPVYVKICLKAIEEMLNDEKREKNQQ